MSQGAQVRSIDAIESFRTSLILYIESANGSLDEVGEEIRRTRNWLEQDQRVYWKKQVRHRTKVFEEAQQAVFNARFSSLRDTSMLEQMQLNKASRSLKAAQEKLKSVNTWIRKYNNQVELSARRLDRLRSILAGDMPKAVHFLAKTTRALRAYSELKMPADASNSTQPDTPPSRVDTESSSSPETESRSTEENPEGSS